SEFRERFKKENPNNKSVAVDKAQYAAIAEKKKEEYEKAIRAYNLGLSEGKAPSEEEGSDKSKSEVNDEDDDDDDEDDE
ncbi:hypothetical protein TSUD_223570, partial [Trifolium subterraneum]